MTEGFLQGFVADGAFQGFFFLWYDFFWFFFFPCELVGMYVPYCFSGFCSARVSSVLEGGYRLLAVGREGDD
jgi:hypothetical protein